MKKKTLLNNMVDLQNIEGDSKKIAADGRVKLLVKIKNKAAFLTGSILIMSLLFSSCKKEEDIPLTVDFTYDVIDNSFTVPVRISFANKTEGATSYKWTFEGGEPAVYDKREPGTITFNSIGTIHIKLEAWNDAERNQKEITIALDSVVKASFDAAPIINDFAPAEFNFNNTSLGAATYSWQFPGALTTISVDKNPVNIKYNSPGTYRVYLQSKNVRGVTDTISKLINVRPALSAAFTIDPSFDDADDYQAPLNATLHNNTISATIHNWQAPGGVVTNPADSMPTVYYANPGTYTVTYTAGNGKQTQTVTQTIIVHPNTGLRTFNNIKLGINSADASMGCYFSTILRQKFKSSEVNALNGSKIDLCFFGLNNIFSFNKFISPDSAQFFTFPAIPGATKTNYVNMQETCNCGPVFTETQFDNVTAGSALNAFTVPATGGNMSFTASVIPRIILFQNQSGKKGAIKIKQFVSDGLQSYIMCDIKIQKE
jgi:PKD repeat protein